MNQKGKPKGSQNPADIWQEFVQSELKSGSKLGKMLESSQYGGYDNRILTIYLPTEELCKAAKGQSDPIKKKLQKSGLMCDRINVSAGSVPVATSAKRVIPSRTFIKSQNPLQALYWVEPNLPAEKDEEQRMRLLKATVEAEQHCQSLYTQLNQRTQVLVGEMGVCFKVSFNWRLRVGGTRGFRELLLPVLHPVFGIPYIPAASLKGATLAWARNNSNQDAQLIQELLGMLKGKVAKAAKVEFLDAFPTGSCLSVDVATPQWSWQNDQVVYQPIPHPLLSLEQPHLCIGLRPAARGTSDDVTQVKTWLENALKVGIGSRVSSGYGRALSQKAAFSHHNSFEFELWTQGMYGCNPREAEFRPTAVRGILRYWFRAMAMALYDTQTCQTLENRLFGTLGKQGELVISTVVNPPTETNPYSYNGKIYLEAKTSEVLHLASQLLLLASHLGGVGRGSRRPLHLLDGRMRGCHWEVGIPLDYNKTAWQKLVQVVKAAFRAIHADVSNLTCSPGSPKSRKQDVLDKNAQVWLLKSSGQELPNKSEDWLSKGEREQVRGTALTLLYSSDRFKGEREIKDKTGEKMKIGNPHVGGALGIPSFVWIKSIFTINDDPYQVVTIFGADDSKRQAFATALRKEKADLVLGNLYR
ncbi:MAG TPA: RAMP superfamily CRISPR-associated protein [Leptolyngbyaceae cyanobacterium]